MLHDLTPPPPPSSLFYNLCGPHALQTVAFERTGSCDDWNDPSTWSDSVKQGLITVAYAHMDALPNWYYWTWKIGESLKTPGKPPNPMWHLKREYRQHGKGK